VLAQIFAWLGLLDLILLEYVRAGVVPGCGAGSACVEVTSGEFGRLLGVPWTWLGLTYFAMLSLVLPQRPGWARAFAPVGVVVSLGLVVLQVAVIGQVCPFCVASAACSVLFMLALWREPRPAQGRGLVIRLGVTVLLLALGLRAAYKDHIRLESPNPEVAAGVRHWRGKGPVRFVLIMDLKCPHCGDALHELLALPADQVSLGVRFFPSDCPDGPACKGAAACYGAADFWTALLDAERAYGGQRMTNLPPDVLERWLASGDQAALAKDVQLAKKLELVRIPVLYVNDRRVHGPLSAATLRGFVSNPP
jgi:uncharacterized membrane protein